VRRGLHEFAAGRDADLLERRTSQRLADEPPCPLLVLGPERPRTVVMGDLPPREPDAAAAIL